MKLAVQAVQAGRVPALNRPAGLMDDGFEVAEIRIRKIGEGGLNPENFERRPDEEDLFDLLDVRRCDSRADVGDLCDQPVRFEFFEGFADGDETRPGHRGQLAEDKPLARLVLARDNAHPQGVVDVLRLCGEWNGAIFRCHHTIPQNRKEAGREGSALL